MGFERSGVFPVAARTANVVVLAVVVGGFAVLLLYPQPVVAAIHVTLVAVLTIAIRVLEEAGFVD